MAAPRPIRRPPGAARRDEQLRLMTKVSRLYHERGVLQPEIARRLHISQPRVSRLLKQAEQEGIVRTTGVVPDGMWTTGVEDLLEEAYGLREAVVVECFDPSEEGIAYDLGVATATYLEASLTGGDVVGISSWSATLPAAVDSMRRLPRVAADRVIQLFGGVGDPSAEAHAARLTQRFADLTGAKPTFLLAPGIATSPEAREALMQDQFVQEAMAALDHVTLALVGIGALEPSSLLQRSGNIFSEDELQALGARSAVGDICLRFFDAAGRPVASDFDRRVTEVPPAAKEPKSPGETTASRRARSPIRRTLRNPVSTVRRLCAAARRSGGALRSEGMEPAGTALGTQRADRRGAPLKEPFRQPRRSGCAIDRAGCRAGRSPLPAAE